MLSRSRWRIVSAGLALLAAAAWAQAADTQQYPNKPIRLIVPFPPDGSADPLARAYGQWFSEKFGVNVVADNRPGAGTAIAHTLGAHAAPDGYTLLLGASSGLTTNPASGAKLDYDPIKDFEPVGLAAYVPQMIVVHPSVPAKTFPELIALAKTPGKMNFGTPGVGSVGHLTVAFFNAATGANFTHVPYKGAGPAMVDLLANRVQVFVGSVTGTQAQIQAGKCRAIATGHSKRVAKFPDVPTVAESGGPAGYEATGWTTIAAPRGLPKAVQERIQRDIEAALAEPDIRERYVTFGYDVFPTTKEQYMGFISAESAKYAALIKRFNLSLD